LTREILIAVLGNFILGSITFIRAKQGSPKDTQPRFKLTAPWDNMDITKEFLQIASQFQQGELISLKYGQSKSMDADPMHPTSLPPSPIKNNKNLFTKPSCLKDPFLKEAWIIVHFPFLILNCMNIQNISFAQSKLIGLCWYFFISFREEIFLK
jgi:hypothetical protein